MAAHEAFTAPAQAGRPQRWARALLSWLRTSEPGISLFWRTFLLLALLLAGSLAAWHRTVRELEYEPQASLTAHQIATLVHVLRAVLHNVEPAARPGLLQTLARDEGLQAQPRQPADVMAPPKRDALNQHLVEDLRQSGADSVVVASRVNGVDGLWVGFTLDGQPWWLRIAPEHLVRPDDLRWIPWMLLALGLTLAGAALLARLINRPLRQLWLAASRVGAGDYASSQLDEAASTNEVREVNIGFNRMAARLAMVEHERAVMLAGISHDLRTPLARLRLETELSVQDETSRAHMSHDIEQLDRTLDKFLEYARPLANHLESIDLQEVLDDCLLSLRDDELDVALDLDPGLRVLGDSTELARICNNLLENARRYGKTAGTARAQVEITGRRRRRHVTFRVRDHGPGVPAETLPQLTQAFFRGDAARTSATGAGLGLSIVERAVLRMGGTLHISCPPSGGLAVTMRLNPG